MLLVFFLFASCLVPFFSALILFLFLSSVDHSKFHCPLINGNKRNM